jgi:hypothetical protein
MGLKLRHLVVLGVAVYHWHSILPDSVLRLPSAEETNALLSTNEGITSVLTGAMGVELGRVGPHSVPPMPFRPVEIKTMNWARQFGVGSFNDFRAMIGLPRYHDWAWVSPGAVDDLKELYKDPEAVELFVGLYVERCKEGTFQPDTMGFGILADAFSSILEVRMC